MIVGVMDIPVYGVPTRAPKEWTTGYPEATWNLINRDNYLEFIA